MCCDYDLIVQALVLIAASLYSARASRCYLFPASCFDIDDTRHSVKLQPDKCTLTYLQQLISGAFGACNTDFLVLHVQRMLANSLPPGYRQLQSSP